MRAAVAVAKKTGPKPKPDGPREALIAVRCRQSYKDWVVELATENRTDPSDLIDRALVAFAKANGFRSPPLR